MELADKIAAMARGSRDLAAEAQAVANHFRPEFLSLRGEGGSFRDAAAKRRALEIYRFVIDSEHSARRWSKEAETLEQAAAALSEGARSAGNDAEYAETPPQGALS